MNTFEIDKKIRKGLPPKRNAECIQTAQDIVIPAGTIMRDIGGDVFAAPIGVQGVGVEFSITLKPGVPLPSSFGKKVVVS